MCWKSTRVCVCWEVNRLAGLEWPSQQRFPQWDLASRMITHSHQIGLSCMEDPSPWRFILLHLRILHTIRRSFVELHWRFSDICGGKKVVAENKCPPSSRSWPSRALRRASSISPRCSKMWKTGEAGTPPLLWWDFTNKERIWPTSIWPPQALL